MNKDKIDTPEVRVSAAERLGRALLASLGEVPGADENEIVDAILSEWTGAKEKAARPVKAEKPAIDPFAGVMRPPVPMRADSSSGAPLDYADMSRKQFGELKKLLKKAAADGRKIKL